MPVDFATGSEGRVHAEFQAFLAAHPEEAADSLAIVHHVAAAGLGGLDGSQRDRLGMARPYCHQAAGWGVFFEVAGPWNGPCTVMVLTVADFRRAPIDRAVEEAIGRWRAAMTGGMRP